ncbi:arginyl-tRNA synthetase [Binucleata daphniae]
MNIENLYDSIQTKLKKYTDFDSNALIYSKNSINGDFIIHVSRLKSFECVQKNLHELEIKHIKKVTFDKNNLCFFVDKQEVAYEILETIYKKDSYFGYQAKKDKLVVIEYSSPNIAKKFHPGHFRNTVLGNFINNLLIVNGYKTHTINYLGDWGKQFGLIGVGYEKYGDENKMKEDPIKHLYDIYVQINNDKAINNDIDEKAKMWFTDLENGKIENVKLWQRFREMSVEKYKSL